MTVVDLHGAPLESADKAQRERPALTLDDLRGRAFISVEEFASLPGSPSRGNCYEAVRAGTIPSLHLGRRVLIPVPRLLELLGVSDDRPRPDDKAGMRGSLTDAGVEQ